jgi:DNA-binding HxlR family transcriptional regulator
MQVTLPAEARLSTVAALDIALARVGDRWSLLIVDALLPGPLKYGELATVIDAIAPNILAARLKRLAHDGLVLARPYSNKPVRLEYELTASGGELAAAVQRLTEWAARLEGHGDVPFHSTCGTAIEYRAWCPTCDVPASDDGTIEL